MAIRDDFNAVCDENGLVQPGIGQGSNNGVLYTGEAMIVMHDNGALDIDQIEKYQAALDKCEKLPGLISRSVGNTDQEGPDDLHGAIVASMYLDDGERCRRMVAYGEAGCTKWDPQYEDPNKLTLSKWVYRILSLGGLKRVKWVYNNHNPGYFTLSAWFGRMPGLIAEMKLVAGKTPSPFEYLAWIVGVFLMFGKNRPDTDAFILPYCSIRVAREKSFILKPFAALGVYRLRKVWGSFAELIKYYFNNPNHPTGVYSKE